MHKGKLTSLVLVLVVVMVAALALAGCGSSETKVNADEVVQNALAAQAGVDSSTMAVTVDATVSGAAGEMSLNVNLNGTINGDMDWANKKMKGHIGMNVGLTGDMTFNTQVTGDMYAFDNVAYMQMTMMGSTSNWMRDSLPVDFWSAQQNTEFINGLLQSTSAESLPDQKVGGVNCHVLKLTPDIGAIQEMLGQQAAGAEEMPDIDTLISTLSIKVWVAKDTSYVTKIEIKLVADIPSEVMGGTEGGEGLAVDVTITMQFSDFNKSASIQLPAEAEDAEEGFSLPFDFSGFF